MRVTIEELREIAKNSPQLQMKNQVGQWEDGTWYSSWIIGGRDNIKGKRNITMRTGDGGALEYYDMLTSEEHWIKSLNELNINELIKNVTGN